MITYNHAKYIREAIEGVLTQRCNFDFKLVIGEDGSSDRTRSICSEYKNRYPEKIVLLSSDGNIGMGPNFVKTLSACEDEYIALCEGDDYWTDPLKLQKQVDFLESRPDISGCFHDACTVNESGDMLKENYFESYQETYNQFDCVTKLGSSYATCTLVFRSGMLKKLPLWFIKSPCDYTLDILITEHGNLAHIDGNMGAYRIHNGGTWQGNKPNKNIEAALDRYKILLSDRKLKKEYGHYFRKATSDFSYLTSITYRKERQWFKQVKYAWYYFLNKEEKDINSFRFFLSAFLFPIRSSWKKD